MTTPAVQSAVAYRWRAFADLIVRGFHAYGSWLVGISWKRFFLLSLLLLILAALLQNLPPFSWKSAEVVEQAQAPAPPVPPKPPRAPAIKIERASVPASGLGSHGAEITIDERGVRIVSRPKAEAAPAPSGAGASAPAGISIGESGVQVKLPPGADSESVREAVKEAKQAILEALRDAEEARTEAGDVDIPIGPRHRIRTTHFGDFLPELALLWIVASMILKITYTGRLQAEVKAAQATEAAESETLKRQVVEARMAAMQAQVEPHFLFNTLASIDHLIETDPRRASRMQKNLIALLRASMPTLREANDGGLRDLGRELAVIRPYLEILKVRMEDRLTTAVDVPDGLHSAQFPPMMLQTLVENAIKHGLEPKPEGGALTVKAEIVHGKLAVSVGDTGLGFGKAATAGTGVGLANIRERLQLLYGGKASLAVAENAGGGTVVTITVPYTVRTDDGNGA